MRVIIPMVLALFLAATVSAVEPTREQSLYLLLSDHIGYCGFQGGIWTMQRELDKQGAQVYVRLKGSEHHEEVRAPDRTCRIWADPDRFGMMFSYHTEEALDATREEDLKIIRSFCEATIGISGISGWTGITLPSGFRSSRKCGE